MLSVVASAAKNGTRRTLCRIHKSSQQRYYGCFPVARRMIPATRNNSIATTRQFSSRSDTPKRQNPKTAASSKKAPKPKQQNTSSLAGVMGQAEDLNQRMAKLDPLPLSLTVDMPTDEYQDRLALFQDTKDLVNDILIGVQEKRIQPSRKHGPELSLLFGTILKLFSFSASPPLLSDQQQEDRSAFEECLSVLSVMDQWNLSRHAQHYHYTILTAIHEQLWKEASALFLQQIDPDVSGFTPIDISVSSPVGLYAIARASQEQDQGSGALAVEEVLDAVVNLSLISPSDQEKHVLAAGTALGLAGEWQALVEYLENSYNASRLGQPLVAATMYACILCQQYDEALRVFQTLSGDSLDISSEFQWGGERHQVSPLCRDLAMRAMGRSTVGDKSEEAIRLFQQVLEDDLTISIEALQGVVGACELDQKWEEAVGVLFTYLRNIKEGDSWVVPASDLKIPHIDDGLDDPNVSASLSGGTELLSSVMRTCSTSRKAGVALLCFQLVEVSHPTPHLFTKESPTSHDNLSSIEQSMLPFILDAENVGDFLSATMVSLCGVGCCHEAANLFESTKKYLNDRGDRRLDADQNLWHAEQIYQYALSHSHESRMSHVKWESAHRHIHRLSRALHDMNKLSEKLSTEQSWVISYGLAAALRSCSLAGQPETGLLLAEQTRVELLRLESLSAGRGRSIFGSQKEGSAKTGLLLNDSLLAEQMNALQATNQGDVALALFGSSSASHGDSIGDWPQSCNAAMSVLSEKNELEEAVNLFRTLVSSTPNVESFANIAQIFANRNRWNDVGDVYHMALKSGCLSEPLGLLAMKAVIEMNVPGRLRVLRGIINDAAQSAGTTSVDWIDSNYFKIKDMLGFAHARLLNWWNDPNTSHLDELQFALDLFEKRKAAGLSPKNAALRLIVSNASNFNERGIPVDKKEIVRVPRSRDEWTKLLQRVIDEAEGVLDGDAAFIDQVATALRHLKCDRECVQYVQGAISRGIRVRQIAIREALRAAESAGIPHEASEIRLMLAD